MSQAQELERRTSSIALRARIKAVAKAISQMWEGYIQSPTAC